LATAQNGGFTVVHGHSPTQGALVLLPPDDELPIPEEPPIISEDDTPVLPLPWDAPPLLPVAPEEGAPEEGAPDEDACWPLPLLLVPLAMDAPLVLPLCPLTPEDAIPPLPELLSTGLPHVPDWHVSPTLQSPSTVHLILAPGHPGSIITSAATATTARSDARTRLMGNPQ
jgi:hypothetical protein